MATLLGSFTPDVDLETGEVIDGPVRVRLIEYPDGVELTAVPHAGASRGERQESSGLDASDQEAEVLGPDEARRRQEAKASRSADESVRRARTRVRRIVRYFGLCHMVTLTFPGEGVHDYDRALRLLQDFVHDHGARLHLGGHYVAVPELHPGGHGWHWHVLVHRRFTGSELSRLWEGWTAYLVRRDMEPTGGAQYVRVDVKKWGSACAAAGYAAKYVGKGFGADGRGKNRRRFLASHGAVVQAETATAHSLKEVEDAAAAVPGGMVKAINGEDGRPPIVWASWDTGGRMSRR